MMNLLITVLLLLLDAYFWVIIATVVVSWLVVFDVLNTRNKWVYKLCQFLNVITNPLVLRLRKIIPPLGGVDITPMVIIFGIYGLQRLLVSIAAGLQ
ncbi:MAG: YggT family protein [Micavibrio sp.]|nr:YggT family protein [Micavibrio sp.]